jgi:hypothetical protein
MYLEVEMDKRIQNIEHDVDGWWIYLKPGFIVKGERVHAIVEARKKDALDKMSIVEPCTCSECQRLTSVLAVLAEEPFS